MKISKGMYIRTKKGIGKIDKTRIFMEELEIHLDSNKGKIRNVKDNTYWNNVEDIIGKPSFNIIDLIEVGDYVNGNKVTKLGFDKLLLHCKTIECHQEDLSRGYEGVTFVYTNNDITDIVTKEQFNSMKYVVERDK